MATATERSWRAHIVISSEHAGLRPEFKRLEAELMRVLARLDDTRKVRDYLQFLRLESRRLCEMHPYWLSQK